MFTSKDMQKDPVVQELIRIQAEILETMDYAKEYESIHPEKEEEESGTEEEEEEENENYVNYSWITECQEVKENVLQELRKAGFDIEWSDGKSINIWWEEV